MRILFVHNFYKHAGGEDQVFWAEIDLMKSHGHDVHSYTVDNDTINSLWTKINTTLHLSYSSKSKKNFSITLKKINPDIVHCHNFFPLLTPSIFDACREDRIPAVLTLHNYRLVCPSVYLSKNNKPWELSIKKNPYWAVPYKVYQNSFIGTAAIAYMINYHKKRKTWQKKLDHIITLTKFAKNKFIESGFSPNNMVVKPNFISDPLKENNTRGQFALFIGRLSQEKGIEFLLESWKEIDFPLKIVGDGPMMGNVKLQGNNVEFLGKIPNKSVKTLLQKAQFLVFPSQWYEGFPMVLVEAMACGTPVLVTNIGSMQEIITDELNGLHFELGNQKQFIEKVHQLMKDESLCQFLGDNGRSAYLENYTPDVNYQQLISIYQNSISNYGHTTYPKIK